MKSVIPLLSHEELCKIREQYDFVLRSGVRVSMASLRLAENFIEMHPKTRNGFKVSYLPNIEEHAKSLVVRRYIQQESFSGGDYREYMIKRMYRMARDWQGFNLYQKKL